MRKDGIYNVMLVDDEAYMIDLMLETVNWKSFGLNVVETAVNGYMGYNKFVTGEIDIIITDIKMPIMSGVEMTRKIRELGKRVEIIFVSSYEDFENAKKAIDFNVVGYILKPLDDDELKRAVNTAIERLRVKDMVESGKKDDKISDGDGDDIFIIEKIKEYIQNNLSSKLSVKEVAEHMRYSPNYIGHLFKKGTGMFFNDYVTYVKMEKAKRLLRLPQNHIGDIAYQLGYTDLPYFTKQFKRYCGVPPKAYRDKMNNKE